MEPQPSQAALILEASDEGEISVSVATNDSDGLAAALCRIIAEKLSEEALQTEILAVLETEAKRWPKGENEK